MSCHKTTHARGVCNFCSLPDVIYIRIICDEGFFCENCMKNSSAETIMNCIT